MAAQKFLKGLSGKKKRLAELLVNPDFDGTVSDVCREAKISRQTFYTWLRDPKFKGALEAAIDDYTDSELAHVWRAVIARAEGGSVEAAKLYFELKGRYKQQVDINGGVVFISGEDEISE